MPFPSISPSPTRRGCHLRRFRMPSNDIDPSSTVAWWHWTCESVYLGRAVFLKCPKNPQGMSALGCQVDTFFWGVSRGPGGSGVSIGGGDGFLGCDRLFEKMDEKLGGWMLHCLKLTAFTPLKIGPFAPKGTEKVFQPSIFRCKLAVFREGILKYILKRLLWICHFW